ncbi:MAG: CBS domain-containing protein [Thiogranum sp.]
MAKLRAISQALSSAYIDSFPQEATEVLESTPVDEITQLLKSESPQRAARILGRISTALASAALAGLGPDVTRRILSAMDPVSAALLLGSLSADSCERQLNELGEPLARELRDLMSYPPASAGSLMQPRATSFPASMTVKQALRRLRRYQGRDTSVLVVIDDEGKLAGLLELVELVQAPRAQRLDSLVRITNPVSVNAVTPREEIVELFSRYRLRLLPVVDIDNRLIGIIH